MPGLTIDLSICKKSGQCYYMQPELVRRGADNLPELVATDVSTDRMADAEELVDCCPTGAITLTD